jgi:hypothetical protein
MIRNAGRMLLAKMFRNVDRAGLLGEMAMAATADRLRRIRDEG